MKGDLTNYVHKFFIHCDPEARHFYTVEIHPTRGSMLRALRRMDPKGKVSRLEARAGAMCVRFLPVDVPRAEHRFIGTMFFVHGQVSAPVVLHEMTHAAIGWAKLNRVDPLGSVLGSPLPYLKDPEERFVRTLQYMFEQYMHERLRLGSQVRDSRRGTVPAFSLSNAF